MRKALFLTLSLAALAGCAGNNYSADQIVSYRSVESANGKHTTDQSASGIRMDGNYVVTSKRVAVSPDEGKVAYVCDDGCDLQFVEAASTAAAPQWRNVVANEKLAIKGSHNWSFQGDVEPRQKGYSAKGVDSNMEIQTTNSGNTWVRLARMDSDQGILGGPIYGQDNKIVGMLSGVMQFKRVGHDVIDKQGVKVGSTPDAASTAEEGKYQTYAAYIPYEVVQTQWSKFKIKQAMAGSTALLK